MSGEHQTTLLISEQQRTDWEEYVGENPEYNSKADLIRRAVQKEIETETQPDAQVSKTEDFEEIKEELRQLRTLVEDLGTTVEAIEARTREPAQNIRELANEVFAVLPPSEDHIWKWERGEIRPETEHETDPTAHAGTLTAIANTVGAEEHLVVEAIELLEDDSHRIQTADIGDELRWYKEV